MLSARERADNFEQTYPKYSPLVIHNDRLYGFWLIGRWYASNRQFYGSYPPSYLNRVRTYFFHAMSYIQEKFKLIIIA
ncbi:unnamed protein product [marine sediment metagenome]|uniref:Uncharacterized protein n=1 Tax=marine sediment metagenome TaxID=412755 RepID=X1SWG3_9ZZZZ